MGDFVFTRDKGMKKCLYFVSVRGYTFLSTQVINTRLPQFYYFTITAYILFYLELFI